MSEVLYLEVPQASQLIYHPETTNDRPTLMDLWMSILAMLGCED